MKKTKNPLQRRYKVPRGTAAELARAKVWSARHVGLVIKGERVPSPGLATLLRYHENLAGTSPRQSFEEVRAL